MKTSRFIKNALIFAFISVFAGCSNLLDSKDDSSISQNAKQGKFVISLKNQGAKAIRAFDYSISDIALWKLTFTDKNNSKISLTTGEQTAENSPSATYDKSAGKITATKIPAGTYTVSLEGSYTKNSATYTISGSADEVVISADSSGSTPIFVGPKSTSDGTGSISLTFTDPDKKLSDLASSLKITLTNLFDKTKIYTYEPNSPSNSLVFDSSPLKLSGSEIKSGWYKISFSAGDSYRVYLPDEPDQFVEIVDGNETAATTAISAESGKAYYTNISGVHNGLSENSRIRLNTLLTNLSETMPEEGNIYIYFYSKVLYFSDAALLNSFKEKVGENNKKVIFYGEDENEELIEGLIIGDGAGSTTTTLKDSVSFTSGDDATTFEINEFDLSGLACIFLDNGTMIDATDVTSYNSNYRLNFTLSSGIKNNFSAYSSTPFLTAGTDLSSYIKLNDCENGKNTTDYAVVVKSETIDRKTVYKHYVKPVGNGTITAESFAEKVSINAAYKSDSSTIYKTDSAIPYTNDNLTFSLSGLDNESATYAWYLNETDLDSAAATFSFNPYSESNINTSGTNTVSCSVTISGTTYVAEMKFTFAAARSAAVWFDGMNMSLDATFNLKQLADNTDTSTTASELVSATSSTLYCFDSSRNLWTAVLEENSSIKLTKYLINVETGLYSTTGIPATFGDITTTPIDMTYDTKNGCLYLLTGNAGSGYTLYKILPVGTDSTFTFQTTNGTLSATTADNNTFMPAQIAVYDSTLYVGAGSTSIYKAALTASDRTLTVGTASTWLVIHSSLDSSDLISCTITDMQIGDGLGNETDNLFVILRQHTDKITLEGTSETNTVTSVYSRGALIQVAIADSEPLCSKYGWSSDSSVIKNSDNGYGKLYAPNSSSGSVNFYGPTHFVAVVPKKLVILDDGFSYEEEKTLKNQDRLMEFDFSKTELSCGASVSASKPSYSSGFTWN